MKNNFTTLLSIVEIYNNFEWIFSIEKSEHLDKKKRGDTFRLKCLKSTHINVIHIFNYFNILNTKARLIFDDQLYFKKNCSK